MEINKYVYPVSNYIDSKNKLNQIFSFGYVNNPLCLYQIKGNIVEINVTGNILENTYFELLQLDVHDINNPTFYELNSGLNTIELTSNGFLYINYMMKNGFDLPEATQLIQISLIYNYIPDIKYEIVEYGDIIWCKSKNISIKYDIYDNYVKFCKNLLNIPKDINNKIYIEEFVNENNIRNGVIHIDPKGMIYCDEPIWPIQHEIGHLFQGLITFPGILESSSNIFCNIYNMKILNKKPRIEYSHIENKHYLYQNIWVKHKLFIDLYKLLGYDFYVDLFKELFNDRLIFDWNIKSTANETYLKFVRICCKVSGKNLYDLFNKYHFFDEYNDTYIIDYKKFEFECTKEMINDTINYCKQFK